MEPKNSKIFNKPTMQMVSSFCVANNIVDEDEFIYRCFKQGFDIKKFGLLGNSNIDSENDLTEKIFHLNEELEKERQKFSTITDNTEIFFQNEMDKKNEELDELRRTLDKVLDKPVIEVDKLDGKMKMLQETLLSLRKEIQVKNKRIEELEKINQDFVNMSLPQQGASYLRGSNLNSKI
jgi:polyhydroxyalkanoate synthesis regulator phasin